MHEDRAKRMQKALATAASAQPEAYLFLLAWHGWCHAIDDHVDNAGRPAEVVDLCADAAVIFSCSFYSAHASQLAPIVSVVAAKYRTSLTATGILQDALRIAGNDMVLAVAYLTGGEPAVRRTAELLFPLVAETQLEPSATP